MIFQHGRSLPGNAQQPGHVSYSAPPIITIIVLQISIIATPGRFLHLVVEMELKLSSVDYVVFDEADR